MATSSLWWMIYPAPTFLLFHSSSNSWTYCCSYFIISIFTPLPILVPIPDPTHLIHFLLIFLFINLILLLLYYFCSHSYCCLIPARSPVPIFTSAPGGFLLPVQPVQVPRVPDCLCPWSPWQLLQVGIKLLQVVLSNWQYVKSNFNFDNLFWIFSTICYHNTVFLGLYVGILKCFWIIFWGVFGMWYFCVFLIY